MAGFFIFFTVLVAVVDYHGDDVMAVEAEVHPVHQQSLKITPW